MPRTLEGIAGRLAAAPALDSAPAPRPSSDMADELEPPVRVTFSRQLRTPPWRTALRTEESSVHAFVGGAFELARPGGRVVPVGAGDVVLIGADCGAIELRALAGAPALAELISARFPRELVGSPGLGAPPDFLHLAAADVRRDRGLSSLLGLLRGELAAAPPRGHEIARALLAPLVAYLLRCAERGAGAAAPADARVARALELMRSRLERRWTVASLARAAGLSRAAFARRFLAELGAPPLRHLTELRLARAAELLVEGDASLAAVAAEVGYESEFAFGRAFKRRFGVAPGVYRRARGEASRLVLSTLSGWAPVANLRAA
jgi:AraC-like DNA-binding protein